MPDTTKWTWAVDPSGKASLWVSINGQDPSPVVLKGVCYSPAPLGGSNGWAPALGDWFWDDFTGNGTTITGWDALWDRDIPCIQRGTPNSIQANSIRVYSMISRQLNSDGSFPSPSWNSGHQFSHNKFLDTKCWGASPPGLNALWTLVGVPLPSDMFWKTLYVPGSELTEFWTNVLQETAQDLGQHPAVMGFTIQNEQDGGDVCYNNPDWAEFWWSQVNTMAGIVKKAAPDKLVGMAVHDDVQIPGKAASYMAQCTNIDFWGVNTYQTQNFDAVFRESPGPKGGPGYSGLTGAALKPVILTEYGLPATGHRNPNDPSTIYEDPSTRQNTANVIGPMLPKAFQEPLCIGLYYFEFCDEWWNEPLAPNVYTWWGGTPNAGFPNGYWDQDGFGLYSISRGTGLNNSDPIWVNNGPNIPIDVHTERTELTTQVKAAFSAASP